MRKLLCAVGISLALALPAGAANIQDSVASISAYKCFMWAELMGDKQESARLFDYGVKAGRQFLEDAKAKKFTAEEYNKTVPIVWGLNAGGPTVDFVLGVVFTRMTDDAYDEVAKTRPDGMVSNDPKDWTIDKELLKARSSTEYLTGNCKLIGN